MIADTYAALKDRFRSGVGMSGRVFESARVDSEDALVRDLYLIVFPQAPSEFEVERHTAVADFSNSKASFEFRLRWVGESVDDVLKLMDRSIPLVLGHRLVVAGRVNDPIRVVSSGPVYPDRTVKPPLFYGDASAVFESRPV